MRLTDSVRDKLSSDVAKVVSPLALRRFGAVVAIAVVVVIGFVALMRPFSPSLSDRFAAAPLNRDAAPTVRLQRPIADARGALAGDDRMAETDQDYQSGLRFIGVADGQLQSAPPTERLDLVLRVDRGDTLTKMLTDVGVTQPEAYAAITALTKIFDARSLRIGQIMTVTLATPDDKRDPMTLLQLALRPQAERDITVRRTESGAYVPGEVVYPVNRRIARHGGKIDDSLFGEGLAAGIPASILAEIIKAFSYDVDFQRDMHPGDGFEVVFERVYTSDGRLAREGRILFAELTLRGKRLAFYRYKPDRGEEEYFQPDGQSIVKSLLRTPIDGAKISSRFGMRDHPILGYSRLHSGVDFAAPPGTPVYAAGSGTVEKASVFGGYGNYVKVRHSAQFATAYAHLSGYARGMQAGKRVRQGEIIGYVGTTGMSTGPHLHYEVHKGGAPINPTSVSTPIGPKLAGRDLARFRDAIAALDRQRDYMPLTTAPRRISQATGGDQAVAPRR